LVGGCRASGRYAAAIPIRIAASAKQTAAIIVGASHQLRWGSLSNPSGYGLVSPNARVPKDRYQQNNRGSQDELNYKPSGKTHLVGTFRQDG
jgi:hypothetical protein